MRPSCERVVQVPLVLLVGGRPHAGALDRPVGGALTGPKQRSRSCHSSSLAVRMASLAPSGVLNRSTWALGAPTSTGATGVMWPARVGAAKMRKRTSFLLLLLPPPPLLFSTVLYSDICP